MTRSRSIHQKFTPKHTNFSQSPLLASTLHADEDNQRAVFAFLTKDYAPASGEIVGILKQMLDQMNEDMGGALEEDKKATATFLQMKNAKQTEIAALSKMIEEKTELKGKVAVEIVQAIKAKEDAITQLGDAQAFLVKLKEMCGSKKDEYAVRVEDAQKELAAIQEAVVVLNNDDSLEVFKKTDPRASFIQKSIGAAKKVSFLQQSSNKSGAHSARTASKNQALTVLDRVLAKAKASKNSTLALLALTAKANLKSGVDFSKVLTMIDEMVALLKEEAKNDLEARDSCNFDLTQNEADTKETKHKLSAEQEKVAEMTELIAAKAKLIEESNVNIAESKKAVQEATAQRQKENAAFVEAVDLNTSAVQVIMKGDEVVRVSN